MKRIACAILLGASLTSVGAFAEDWTGTISDAKCGKAHVDGSASSIECVRKCVKGGAAPVLVVGDKVLSIDKKSQAKVMDHLGQKVTISGKLKGGTVTIKSVKMAS